MEREEGFREEIKKTLSENSDCADGVWDGRSGEGSGSCREYHGGASKFGGLFADNESSSAGAVLAVKARGDAKVRMVAFDSNDQLVADLQDRYIDGLVIQKPFQMGYESVKAIGRKLQGQPVESRVDLPAVLVTKSAIWRSRILLNCCIRICVRGFRSSEEGVV